MIKMDEMIKRNILEIVGDDVTWKVNEIRRRINVQRATKKDINRVLHSLKRDDVLCQKDDNSWVRNSCNHVNSHQTKLTDAAIINPNHHMETNERITSHPAVCELLKRQFLAWPDKTFDTVELAHAVGKQSAKDVNSYLYGLEKEGFISSEGVRLWKLSSHRASRQEDRVDCSHGDEQPRCSLEETDAPIPGEINRQNNQTEVKKSISGVVIPNLDIILMENIWPGPKLMCTLSENGFITTRDGNKIQESSGVLDKCCILVDVLKVCLNKPDSVSRLADVIDCSGQKYLAEYLRNPKGQAQPMSEENKEKLRSKSQYLLSNMVLDVSLLHHLLQDQVISDDMEEYICAKRTRGDKIVALLHLLERCGNDAISQLKMALRHTQQQHTAIF